MTGTWYIQRGRSDPLGPFTTEEILEGLAQREIPVDSLVREIAATAWLPFAAVPEFREALATLGPESTTHDASRLAPKAGPAWQSSSDRRVTSGGGGSMPSRPPAASKPEARPRPSARTVERPRAVPSSNAMVGALIAALGVVWAFVRLGALVSPPEGWIAIVDRFHLVRDGSIADLALALVAYPLLFLGVYGARARRPFGVPLIRAVARVLFVGNVVITAVTLSRLQHSPRLAEVGATTSLLTVIIAAPLLFSACAASLFWLFPAASQESESPGETLPSALVAASFTFATLLLFALFSDVVTVADSGSAFVYTDTIGLRLCLEGRREGIVGSYKLESSRLRGFVLERPTRGKFIEDFALGLEGGGAKIGREVELLEGPRAGVHVYLPPEEAPVRMAR